jgi:hypothetical protein
MIQERISLTWFFVLQQRERWTSALFPLKLKDRRNSLLAIFLSILFHRLGYEVNGRQLWVDFAENEKGGNGERNQDQKEVGQGLLPSGAVIVDLLRQVGTGQTGVGIVGERAGELPLGQSVAVAVACIMAGALGSNRQQMLIQQNQ